MFFPCLFFLVYGVLFSQTTISDVCLELLCKLGASVSAAGQNRFSPEEMIPNLPTPFITPIRSIWLGGGISKLSYFSWLQDGGKITLRSSRLSPLCPRRATGRCPLPWSTSPPGGWGGAPSPRPSNPSRPGSSGTLWEPWGTE